MLKRLFGTGRSRNREITEALYDQIVAAARQPVFYSEWEVPDTPLGRFEMLTLHMVLFLERMRAGGYLLADVAQDVTDEFFKDVDHSLRELGIGDVGVPKRMKRLARMFYGRAEAYRAALVDSDGEALAAALQRNIQPEAEDWPGCIPLARYTVVAHAALARQPDETLLTGRVMFMPDPETAHHG
jgi:cytochrome b pre-mRNA-processing protein 3